MFIGARSWSELRPRHFVASTAHTNSHGLWADQLELVGQLIHASFWVWPLFWKCLTHVFYTLIRHQYHRSSQHSGLLRRIHLGSSSRVTVSGKKSGSSSFSLTIAQKSREKKRTQCSHQLEDGKNEGADGPFSRRLLTPLSYVEFTLKMPASVNVQMKAPNKINVELKSSIYFQYIRIYRL